jgi:LuxR family maltose regulon positive regulatory protein
MRGDREWLRALPDDVIRGRSRLAQVRLDEAERALEAVPPDAMTSIPGSLAEAARARNEELRTLPATIAAYRAAIAQAHPRSR